jgi:putative transposase
MNMSKNIIQLNEEVVKGELKELVRKSVEETLNELLDKEADELTSAGKYERTQSRKGYRSGHYSRKLTTTSGEVSLSVPKLKGIPFETAIIERYRRRESSVEEALIEMYLAGVSVRRVEDISEALWGSRVSASTISNLNQKAYVHIEEWRNRPLAGKYPYVYVDGIYLKRNWGGGFENVSILVAIGVDQDGYREVIGAAEGMKEDRESWKRFMVWLKDRGLDGVKLIVGDKCLGMFDAVSEVFPEAKYQRCTVHFYRNVFSVTPGSKMREVTRMLKAIHAQESKEAARKKAKDVVEQLRIMKLKEAAKKVEDSIEETLTYMDFPSQHWLKIRTNNVIERMNREIRRRTRVVGTFPDGKSALMLVCARLRYVSGKDCGTKRYLCMKYLSEAGIDIA